ncbi:hypothetical protein Cgig2_026149 [Carnegiea gigantea]|uniref:Uncharacterized protein n=1 Tax=Carnegiea gigantea TaxID=171969 RepID=A0A9Q1JXL6_9CARY|nr:hypothetical protein Cgig2_026149 [Carnegiea gigantea]
MEVKNRAVEEGSRLGHASTGKPRSPSQRPPEREAFVTVDALKNFMSTMTDTIMHQVQKAIEAANFARPLPRFSYRPSIGCEPSHRHTRILSPCHTESGREVSQLNRTAARLSGNPSQGRSTKECEPMQPQPWDEDCSTEVVATIARGYAEGITRDKMNARNPEVDFLVIAVPTAYSVILSVLPSISDPRRLAPGRECYLVSIRPLVERTNKQGSGGPSPTGKKPRTKLPPMVPKALVVHTIASAEPERPCPEAVDPARAGGIKLAVKGAIATRLLGMERSEASKAMTSVPIARSN